MKLITQQMATELGLSQAQMVALNNFLAFLKTKPISDLEEALNPVGGYIPIDLGGGELFKVSFSVFSQIIGHVAKPLAPTDPAPTATGWYKPTTYSKDPGTNYANAGNLKAVEGYDTLFYFSGSSWVDVKNKMPVLENEMTYDCRISIEGQSNAYGYGVTNDLINNPPYNALGVNWLDEFNRVFIWNPNTNNYENLKLKVNNTGYLNPTEINWFGVEISIALTWLKIHKYGNLYIDKHVENGQPISYFQKGSSFYTTRLIPRKTAANSWLQSRNIKVYDQGFIWIQGESDLNQTQTYYFEALKKLISDRKDDGFIKNYTTVVLAQINSQNANYSLNIANAKLDYINFDKRSKLITYPNSTISDNIHLNTSGQIDLGLQAAKAVFNSDSYVVTDFSHSVNGVDSEARTALKSFLFTGGATGTLVRNFLISETSNYNIFGVANTVNRYLKVNNTGTAYSATNEAYNVWLNIPTKANNISRIDLSIIPYGAPNGEVDKSNLIGVKNGVITTLINWTGAAPTSLQNYSIDVSGYDTVSLGLYTQDSMPISKTQTVKFYKIDPGATEEDSVLNYIKAKTTGLSMWMNVKDEGAKGDGVTDDTAAINAAIVKLNNVGGGTLYFPKGTYIVSQITIPNVVNWNTIHLLGEFPPAQRFGTITARPTYPPNYLNPNGTIIKSNSDTVNAVIYGAAGTSYQQFSTAYLFLENLTVRTSKENPNTDCVNAYYLFQLQCLNVVLDTGVYNVDSIEPTNVKSGLVTPKNQNCALTYLQNMSISGFYHGIRVFEHTNGDSLQIQSCKNALTFEFADHSSRFGRCCFQRNTNQINVVGEHLFVIDQLNMEYAGVGQTTPTNAWQSTVYEINDPQNLGIGNITYANVKGGLGKVTTWRMNGASKVICKRVGAENRTTVTMPSP